MYVVIVPPKGSVTPDTSTTPDGELVKLRRLRAGRLKLQAVLGEQRCNTRRHLVEARAQQRRSRVAAAAFAALIAEPVVAKSSAAVAKSQVLPRHTTQVAP